MLHLLTAANGTSRQVMALHQFGSNWR